MKTLNNINKLIEREPLKSSIKSGSASTVGNYQGGKVSIINSKDVDNLIFIQRFLAAAGLGDGIDKKSISERKVQVEQPRQLLGQARIKMFDQGVAKSAVSTKLAAAYLHALTRKKPLPRPENNVSSLMQHYMGLQKLANALKDSDDNFIALLTPNKGNPATLDELAKNLQEAGDDLEKLGSQLEELDLSPEEKSELPTLLRTLRFNPEGLKRKFRETQNLPSRKDIEDFQKYENKTLLECVENELSELERNFGGQIYASLNALDSAGISGDGLSFLENYSSIVLGDDNFAQAFLRLLENYNLSELVKILPLMKQSLADDLAADQRSTDERKLHHLLTHMSDIHISEALIQSVQELSAALQRIFYATSTHS